MSKDIKVAILQRIIANGDAVDTAVPRNNIGQLFRLVNGVWQWFSYTLEDQLRMEGVKVDGETCIEAGLWQMKVTFSPHFQRELVLLTPLFTPTIEFSGIRMHNGRTEAHTRGCVCMGYGINKEKTEILKPAEKAWTTWVKSINGGILLIENKQLSSNGEFTNKPLP